MYKRMYKIFSIVFSSIGIGLIAVGGLLYWLVGSGAGQLKDSSGNPSGLYVNLFLLLLLGGIGLVFFLIGMVFTAVMKSKERLHKRLKEEGKVLYGEVVTVQQNLSYSVNYRHPYQIIAQYVDENTKTIYQFRSDCILDIPVYAKPGERVKIYVDPNNYKKYYIDLASVMGRDDYHVETL